LCERILIKDFDEDEMINSLRNTFNLPESPILAIVGSGGKTSLLFRLAKEYSPLVILSNTAHLGMSQGENADKVFQVSTSQEIDRIITSEFKGILLITGMPDKKDRYTGLDEMMISHLIKICKEKGIPLLIEADGCRGKPLKAPAPWEPPIPQEVEQVIVCIGANGFGKELSEEWVYRVDDFANLSHTALGDPISPETIFQVIVHPFGGQKNIPQNARRYLLINQADQPDQQEFGGEIAIRSLTAYEKCVIASLNGIDFTKPVQIHRVYSPVAGVILAAGESRRFGSPKLLLQLDGEPLIRRITKVALQGCLKPVSIILGAYPEVSKVVSDLNVNVIENRFWRLGQSSSVKIAMETLSNSVDAVIFLLGDQPFITPNILQKLVHAFSISRAPIIAPVVNGQRTNPVLFSRETFSSLKGITGDTGGRQLFQKFPVELIPWDDEKLLIDIDTIEDLSKLDN